MKRRELCGVAMDVCLCCSECDLQRSVVDCAVEFVLCTLDERKYYRLNTTTNAAMGGKTIFRTTAYVFETYEGFPDRFQPEMNRSRANLEGVYKRLRFVFECLILSLLQRKS